MVTSPKQLLYLRENAREFIANHGVRLLCDLLTLAHLHVQRAHTPLQVRRSWRGDGSACIPRDLTRAHDRQGLDELARHVGQTMLIEGGDIARDSAKEWYYSNAQGEKHGPVGFDEVRAMWENKTVRLTAAARELQRKP